MTKDIHRGTIVPSSVSLVLTASVFALVSPGCGGGGSSANPDSAPPTLTDAKSPSPDLPHPTPDSPMVPDVTSPQPDLAKEATPLPLDMGTGGIGGTDAPGGAGGSAVLDGASADQVIAPPVVDGGVDGTAVDASPWACPSAASAWSYPVTGFPTLDWDNDGNLVTGSTVYGDVDEFPGFPGGAKLTYGGSADALVTKLDPATGNPIWVVVYGDPQDQNVSGTAVTSGNVVAYGVFTGTLDIDPVNQVIPPLVNTGNMPLGFVMGLKDSDGSGVWSKKLDLGVETGPGLGLQAIAGNPGQDFFLVCGATSKIPAAFNPTGSLSGGAGIFIAALKAADGTVMWAKVLGGQYNTCAAAALDDAGNGYFAGVYAGSLDFGLGPLAGSPAGVDGGAVANDKMAWVAKLNGSTGAAIADQSFGAQGSVSPDAIALDGQGNVIMGGNLANAAAFGAQTLTPAPEGTLNAFVAKLDPTSLTPVWARSFAAGGAAGSGIVYTGAADSAGRVMVGGAYISSLIPGPGLPALQSLAGPGATEPFLLALDGASGATLCGNRYGDPSSAGAQLLSAAVNRAGTGASKDRLAISGAFTHLINFGGQSTAITESTSGGSQAYAFLVEM